MTLPKRLAWSLAATLLWPTAAQARKPEPPPARRKLPKRSKPRRLVLKGKTRTTQGGYSGVTPGLPRMPRIHLPRDAAKRCYITWTGFQLLPGGSRIFVQFNRRPSYQLASMGTQVAVTLTGCRVANWNNTRPLFTRFFPTPVKSVDLTRRRRRNPWTLKVRLKRPARFSTRLVKLQGWTYLFLTFRHSHKGGTPRKTRRRPPKRPGPRRPARPIGPTP